jgi:hypothetical protein
MKPRHSPGHLLPCYKKEFMNEVKIIDYTFAIAWYLKDKNCMVFVFEVDMQPVEIIVRSLN